MLLAIIIDQDLCLNSNMRQADACPLEFVKALLFSFFSVYNEKRMAFLMLWQLINSLLILFHHPAG